ncbi:MAG: AsmA-like C-terminal region-containing protein [Crocinitomicaceae bacterium]|nr:AsmA-like C-terminal region-containing protein [Crocinitomicaceae bacterium]
MPIQHFFTKKRIKLFFGIIIIVPVILFTLLVGIIYYGQDSIVQHAIVIANKDLKGRFSVSGSHVAPFANFPQISIDLEHVKVYESKKKNADCLVHVHDVYLGFSLWDIVSGNYTIKGIKLKDGHIDVKQHKDGSINIANALASELPPEKVEEDFHVDLKAISIENIDISKLNEETNLKLDVFINKAKSKFKSDKINIDFRLETDFFISVLQDGDSTFFKHKHIHFDTEFSYKKATKIAVFHETQVELEKAVLDFNGSVHLNNDVYVDLKFKGHKPDFNLFLAVAPDELKDALNTFENRGKIYFNATVKGKTANGNRPALEAHFGCKEGGLTNIETGKKMNDIGFDGYFSNGKNRDLNTMLFTLNNIKVKPEIGKFNGKLRVFNFVSPNVEMQVDADLDLDFLAKFTNASALKDVGGKILLQMNFHDIIDFNQPEKSIERLNESYYSSLKVQDFHAKIPGLSLPIKNFNLFATSKGHAVNLKYLSLTIGKSDFEMLGYLSDLPAIIHHTDIPVEADLKIHANRIDLAELTKDDAGKVGFNEEVKQLDMKLKFITSARAVTESENLPLGEFFLEKCNAKLKNYPHAIHDLHADLLIGKQDLTLKDFKGFLDASDFHFSGIFHHYDFWFKPNLEGDAKIAFDFKSNHLKLGELLYYGGQNHLPAEYRKEELSNFDLKGHSELHFSAGNFVKTAVHLDNLTGKFKTHPVSLAGINGKINYQADKLSLEHLKGVVGHSDFDVSLLVHLDQSKQRDFITLHANRIDVDEFLSHSTQQATELHGAEHDKVWSIFDAEFPNIDCKLDVGSFKYDGYTINKLTADVKVFHDHHVEIKKIGLETAEGSISGNAVFSGRDKNHIYLEPNLTIHHLNLDKFMVKFDNFGQDYLVSQNVHGYFQGKVTGKIHLHADLVPKLDDSNLKVNMTITKGKLENYAPLIDLGTYFEDKNVAMVQFDTLTNELLLSNGKLSIPQMIICSSLGFLKIEGSQGILGKMDMDYTIGVPWAMIKDVARNKIFKRKREEENEPDEIVKEKDGAKYVYFRVSGDLENYSVNLVKGKKK